MSPVASSATRSRYSTSGTFSHPSGITKQVVTTLPAATFGGFGRVLIEVDCSTLTKNSNICGIEASTDGGTTWAPVAGSAITASVAQHFRFEVATSDSIRAVLTSGTAEGATRSIPWKINVS